MRIVVCAFALFLAFAMAPGITAGRAAAKMATKAPCAARKTGKPSSAAVLGAKAKTQAKGSGARKRGERREQEAASASTAEQELEATTPVEEYTASVKPKGDAAPMCLPFNAGAPAPSAFAARQMPTKGRTTIVVKGIGMDATVEFVVDKVSKMGFNGRFNFVHVPRI